MATKKHLGFDKVSNNIAQEYIKKGMSPKKAQEIGDATAANIARNASPAAKKANPHLKNVKGACKTKASMGKPNMDEEMCASKVKCACKTKASASKPMKAACKTKAASKPMKAACKTKAACKGKK